MGVDVLGLPHTIMLTAANINDRKSTIDRIDYYCRNTDYLSDIKKVLIDGGYSGESFTDAVKEISNAEVEVVKRNELHKFVVLPLDCGMFFWLA